MALSLSEKIMYSTLRIEMLNDNLCIVGFASGFLFDFCINKTDKSAIPALVTNRHVLGGCTNVKVLFTRSNADNEPCTGDTISVIISTRESIFHPNKNIDLAILPLAAILEDLASKHEHPFLARLDLSVIPNEEEWNALTAAEDVTMVGYPRGLLDTVNNLPIFRRGITATHPRYDYCGEPKFLVDMACFPGSSGSPVFILNEGVFVNKRTGSLRVGAASVILLGVQHAVPNIRDFGVLVETPSDETQKIPAMQSYINLGIIIKSTELRVFESVL